MGLRGHEHLVRQHFLPKDVHTLERKDAIVTAIVDRGRFSEPFVIASMPVNDPPPDEVAAYEPLIDQLNARTISARLRSIFDANGFTLSPRARVSVVSANKQWTITDDFRHENSTFTITYDLYEAVESDSRNRQIAVLRAGASIDDKPSGRETIPIQLFLSEDENARFRGKQLRLAAYADGPTPQPDDKARFDAVLATLKQGVFASGGMTRWSLTHMESRPTVSARTATSVGGATPPSAPARAVCPIPIFMSVPPWLAAVSDNALVVVHLDAPGQLVEDLPHLRRGAHGAVVLLAPPLGDAEVDPRLGVRTHQGVPDVAGKRGHEVTALPVDPLVLLSGPRRVNPVQADEHRSSASLVRLRRAAHPLPGNGGARRPGAMVGGPTSAGLEPA